MKASDFTLGSQLEIMSKFPKTIARDDNEEVQDTICEALQSYLLGFLV